MAKGWFFGVGASGFKDADAATGVSSAEVELLIVIFLGVSPRKGPQHIENSVMTAPYLQGAARRSFKNML